MSIVGVSVGVGGWSMGYSLTGVPSASLCTGQPGGGPGEVFARRATRSRGGIRARDADTKEHGTLGIDKPPGRGA